MRDLLISSLSTARFSSPICIGRRKFDSLGQNFAYVWKRICLQGSHALLVATAKYKTYFHGPSLTVDKLEAQVPMVHVQFNFRCSPTCSI